MRILNKCFVLIILSLVASSATAKQDDFISWHSTNVQLLRGLDYELGSEQRTVLTLEHANGWKYGDFFVFADQIWSDKNNSTYYIEPTLRLSLSKLTGKKLTQGLIKDVFIAAQFEKPKGQSARKLAGVAVDFNISGFKFFKSHLFYRDNPDLDGNTYQFTLSWNVPLQYKNINFLIEGFTDIAGSEGSTVAHQLLVPRFLMDISSITGMKENKLWLGIEWQYWHNKFGVKGVTESVPQLQLKYIL